jgi:hypothetical protein
MAVITLVVLAVNIYLFNLIPEIVVEKSKIQLIPAIGYMFAFLFHIISVLFILNSFRIFKSYKGFKIFTLIVSVFAIISFLVDKIMIDELADEIRYGFDLSLFMLTIPLVFKLFYTCLILVLVFLYLNDKQQRSEVELKDETIFTLAQIVGLVTGFLGILLVVSQIKQQFDTLLFSIPAYFIFLIPYGIVVLYWILLKFKEKIQSWYDEKQWLDITRSSLITILLSIPGMAMLFLIKQPIEYFWFPYYLFLLLFLFSGTTLILFKKS